MNPNAPIGNPLPPSMAAPGSSQRYGQPVSSGAMAAPKKGVNVLTLVIVAIACLLLGVGITAAVIMLTN